MLDTVLQEYGLSKTEAQSYLTVLELGTAPVSTIARRSGENRVTIYSALKNLVKKGIAIEIPKQNSTYYTVISPEKLIQKFEDKYAMLKEALPQFLAIANKFNNKPKVKFYEGLEGLKKIYEDELLSEKETIHAFLWVGMLSPKLSEYLNLHFLPQRVKLWVHAKVLLCAQDEKGSYPVYNSSKQLLTEYRLLDFDFVKFYNEINIYGSDKIAMMMFSEDEMSGLVIQSKKLHDTLQSLFDLVWFIAEKKCFQQTKKKKPQSSSLQKKEKQLFKKSSSKRK